MRSYHNRLRAHKENIFNVFLPYMNKLTGKSKLNYKTNNLLYIKNGFVIIYHKDSTLDIISGPDFFGAPFLLLDSSYQFDYRLKASKNAEIYEVPLEEARRLLSQQHHLYESFCYVFANRLYTFGEYALMLRKSNAYEKVKQALTWFLEKDPQLSSNISTSSFVVHVTGLSKSRVLYILSELKKGGHIKMNKDHLEIINPLPKKF